MPTFRMKTHPDGVSVSLLWNIYNADCLLIVGWLQSKYFDGVSNTVKNTVKKSVNLMW